MTILYSNGCSYTGHFGLPRDFRYPILLSDRLGWSCEDRAEPGSCNSRIIRNTVADCIKLRSQSDEKIFAMIQLSHLFRFEYPDDTNPIEDPFYSVKPGVSFDEYRPDASKEARQYATLYWKLHNEHQVLINLLTGLVGLSGFFNQNNIDYLIYLGPNDMLLLKDFTYQDDIRFSYLKKDPGILDLDKFYMLDIYGGNQILNHPKHADEIGMQKISDYFYEKISSLSELG